MKLVRTAQPLVGECAVTRTEAKLYCRVDDTAEDSLFDKLIIAGTVFAEEYCRSCFTYKTDATTSGKWTYTLDAFPSDSSKIELPRPPLRGVTTIKYYDENGTQQTWSSSEYRTVVSDFPGFVEVDDDYDWPETDVRPEAVEIIFTAGYTAAIDVPNTVQDAILCYVAHRYRTREPEKSEWTDSIKEMLYPHKLIGIGG